ncbi:MAG: DUF177 domain-containing protein [Geminicoccaceae bacterium]|nr:DUF177 domain-containing protein [Geminicoccaceae bacterium]
MSELTRCVDVDDLPAAGLHLDLEADAAQRRALAGRLDLLDLASLTAAVDVVHGPRPGVTIARGRLCGRATQRCVVTLEPLEAAIETTFERYFVLDAGGPTGRSDAGEILVDVDEEEPEPLSGPLLDLGELVVEEFALALDPYPRSAGADETMRRFQETHVDPTHPFSALARRRTSGGG